jgi:hypothetical protein
MNEREQWVVRLVDGTSDYLLVPLLRLVVDFLPRRLFLIGKNQRNLPEMIVWDGEDFESLPGPRNMSMSGMQGLFTFSTRYLFKDANDNLCASWFAATGFHTAKLLEHTTSKEWKMICSNVDHEYEHIHNSTDAPRYEDLYLIPAKSEYYVFNNTCLHFFETQLETGLMIEQLPVLARVDYSCPPQYDQKRHVIWFVLYPVEHGTILAYYDILNKVWNTQSKKLPVHDVGRRGGRCTLLLRPDGDELFVLSNTLIDRWDIIKCQWSTVDLSKCNVCVSPRLLMTDLAYVCKGQKQVQLKQELYTSVVFNENILFIGGTCEINNKFIGAFRDRCLTMWNPDTNTRELVALLPLSDFHIFASATKL